jgi:predicted RNase H-like nuclease (RuvC/YqgF family)
LEPQKKTPNKGGGRPRKNSPISERRIYVYAESVEQANQWKKTAKNAGMPISRYISELLEDHINAEDTGTARKELQKNIMLMEDQNKQLRAENVNLSQQIERTNKLIERYEEQLQQLKQGAWLEDSKFDGVRDYEKKLISLLKEQKSIREEKLLDLLHILPTDTNAIKAIMNQIETLLDYGVIKVNKGCYQWLL